nr:FHA domain-containing protein [Nocardia africana]
MSLPGAQKITVRHEGTDRIFENTQQVTLGRAPEVTVFVDSPLVSRVHATLGWQGGAWVLSDNGSTNGVFVDAQRITRPVPVDRPMLVRLGDAITGPLVHLLPEAQFRPPAPPTRAQSPGRAPNPPTRDAGPRGGGSTRVVSVAGVSTVGDSTVAGSNSAGNRPIPHRNPGSCAARPRPSRRRGPHKGRINARPNRFRRLTVRAVCRTSI